MNQLSVTELVKKRLVEDWRLLISVFLGFLVVTTLSAAAPVYLESLEELAFNNTLDRVNTPFLNIHIFGRNIPFNEGSLKEVERALDEITNTQISQIAISRDKYLKGDIQLVGLPTRPLPDRRGTGELVARGYLQSVSSLAEHSVLFEGRMVREGIAAGDDGPVVEAMVGQPTAEQFDLKVGDILELVADLDAAGKVTATIVGIVESDDPDSEYWRVAGSLLTPGNLDTEAPPVGVQVDPDEPGVGVFVTEDVIVQLVGQGNPGVLGNPLWFILVDKQRIKDWSISEAQKRLAAFDQAVYDLLPGATVTTAVIRGVIEDIARRSFFSKVPILLLLAVLLVTIFFYLTMMVSYLVQSRERDAALLKSRGVSTRQILRLHALEGLFMTAVAVVVAPFLALGGVALAGLMPYFREMTDSSLLPIDVGPTPFLVALGVGLVCFAIFVISGAIGTRVGLLLHKLRASRPPTIPFFHRYYLDVGVVAVGGLVFWELQSRGQIVSGGLFKEIEINEALLLAPVLFLIAVALVFMRFFPVVVRFISGESPALLHLIVVASVLGLGGAIVHRETRDGVGVETAWLVPVAVLLGIALAYWATARSRLASQRIAGLVVLAALTAGFLVLERPDPANALFFPTLALISIVPGQLLFLLIQAFTRRLPVWVSMGLWRMGRNPLQYTWLVLLLVLATGLGVLSTTVGGTLERSQVDRVLFDIPTDVRITGVPSTLRGGIRGLKQSYLELPDVVAASLAYRTSGSFGIENFNVLALESGQIPRLSWYFREDFSDSGLNGVMRSLQSDVLVEPVAIPEGATTIGLWVKPDAFYPNLPVWLALEDENGTMNTVSLGTLRQPEWHLLEAEIPSNLKHPLSLASVQVLEPGFGLAAEFGSLLIDDIHAIAGPDEQKYLLEGFEEIPTRWTPLATSNLSTDRIVSTGEDSFEGSRSGRFTFGRETVLGIRGIYVSPAGGPIPAVVSSSFLASTGLPAGEYLIARLAGRLVPIVISDTIDYFPTITDDGAFILTDLYYLMSYLNLMGTSKLSPNELYIKRVPGVSLPLEQVVENERQAAAIRIDDMDELMETMRLDPLSSASFGALVLIVLGTVLLATAFGYITYLLLFASTTRIEMGFLQTIGLSGRQLAGLLGFEHLAVVAIGLALGTWAGFQMSRLMVSPLAVTERGEQVLPPYVLMTDWSLMLPTYVGLVGLFVGALIVLNRSIGRVDLQTIARMGEY